jgi:hypothetical protein
MGSGHGHGSAAGSDVRVDHRTRLLLIALVALIGLATLASVAWLWPRGPLPRNAVVGAGQQDTLEASVVAVQRRTCAGSTDDRLADGSVPPTVTCATVRVRLGQARTSARSFPFR